MKHFDRPILGFFFALSLCSAEAALPLTWQMSNPPPTNSPLNAVTYGNGHFMAVGAELDKEQRIPGVCKRDANLSSLRSNED